MASTQQVLPAKLPSKKPIATVFDPVEMRAPFFLRCGAVAFDYLLIIIWPVIGLLVGRAFGVDGAKLLAAEFYNIAWLIAGLTGLSNSVLLPLVTGQSLGKMVTGLRIISSDGTLPSFGSLLLRQTVGYFLVLCTLGLGFFFSAFNAKGRALQDLVSGTQVVFGNASYRSRS